MRKRLVFRVDDVGYTPAYDMGAFKAFECGIASSADVDVYKRQQLAGLIVNGVIGLACLALATPLLSGNNLMAD